MAQEEATTDADLNHVDVKTDSIAGYFDVDGKDAVNQQQLETIAKFLRSDAKEYDDIDMIRDLKALMFKLGAPRMGTSLLTHAYEYAKIASQIKQSQKELERYMR